jgi:hypothetical protein
VPDPLATRHPGENHDPLPRGICRPVIYHHPAGIDIAVIDEWQGLQASGVPEQ